MEESDKMKNLFESVKKVVKGKSLTEARLTGFKTIPVRWKKATLRTKGDGLWVKHDDGEKPMDVGVDKVEFMYTDYGGGYNYYLKVHLDPRTWNGRKLGWVYTDTGFQKELRKELQNQGYPTGTGIEYADTDMQGINHASFAIVGKRIEKEWETKMKVPPYKK